jgi:hypothetical protein
MIQTIETGIELDASDIKKLEALARKLEQQKKQKIAAETVPQDKRVYVMDIRIDSIMTTRNEKHGMAIKGKKACEYLLKQLERKHGRRFYMEEAQSPLVNNK